MQIRAAVHVVGVDKCQSIDKGSSSSVRQQSENQQATGPCSLEHQINRLRRSLEDDYCAKFQVIPIVGFRFIVLTYSPTYIQTHT